MTKLIQSIAGWLTGELIINLGNGSLIQSVLMWSREMLFVVWGLHHQLCSFFSPIFAPASTGWIALWLLHLRNATPVLDLLCRQIQPALYCWVPWEECQPHKRGERKETQVRMVFICSFSPAWLCLQDFGQWGQEEEARGFQGGIMKLGTGEQRDCDMSLLFR